MYNFIHEFIEKNEDIHEQLKKDYPIIDEGSCSIVYGIENNRVLKVFSLKNFLLSDTYFDFELEYYNDKNLEQLEEKLNNELKNSFDFNETIKSFLQENIFDKSIFWLEYCFYNPSKNTPKIYNINLDLDNCCYYVEMEKLDSNFEFLQKFKILDYSNFIDGLQYIFKNIKKASKSHHSMIELFKKNKKYCQFHVIYAKLTPLIYSFLKKFEKNFEFLEYFENFSDFSEQNVLFRGSDIVILDPIR